MKTRYSLIIAAVLAFILFRTVPNVIATATDEPQISGALQNGYRVLTLPQSARDVTFTVYRGDYIKFDLTGSSEPGVLEIPALTIKEPLQPDLANAPYFKMKEVGVYPFTLGSTGGSIEVIEYDRPQYQTLTAAEAALLIDNISPFILDVRTPMEYATGRLENSTLIPVQELQQRYTELAPYKDENIFIYCATGNRSTVAAKILIDNGFTRIHNLRYGLFDWVNNGDPVSRYKFKN